MRTQSRYTNAKGSEGQVMLISVIMLGGILLSAAAIAGLLTIYQIRAANDVVNSAKAIFAADAGIEAVSWCSFKPVPVFAPLRVSVVVVTSTVFLNNA